MVSLSAGLKLTKRFILLGSLCQAATCVTLKMFFPFSDESLLTMLSAVSFVKLPGFRLGGTMAPFF